MPTNAATRLPACVWHDPQSPLRIEFPGAAMEQIRNRAIEAARALPRTGPGVTGLGIGGLLLGERAGAQVRILESAELPCSHAFGPAFVLTPAEKARGRELIEAGTSLQVVGWYCSRPRGELALTEEDLALYRELFPAEWQITLILQTEMLRTDGTGTVRAAFFSTNQTGDLMKGAEHDLSSIENGLDPLPDPVHLPEPPRRSFYLTWILTAIAGLAIGAAVFEIQNGWLTTTPPQPAPSAEIP